MALVWMGDRGPLVLLAETEAKGWLGAWRPATDRDPPAKIESFNGMSVVPERGLGDPAASDYARTCLAVRPPAAAGLVPFRGGIALALETSGDQVAPVLGPNGAVIARWISAESKAAAEHALENLPADLPWEDTGLVWHVRGGPVRLHIAAARFEGGGISFPLGGGDFAVETAPFNPDDETSFDLWRLRPTR